MGFMRGEGGSGGGGGGVPTLTASRAVVTNGSGALAAATTTAAEVGYLNGVTSAIQTQLNAKAPLASPTLTGTPAAPTAAADTNTTQIATTAMVQAAIANAVVGLLELKGSTDASANPNYPAASKGDAYTISVAGKIGGGSGRTVEIGDVVVAIVDNAGGTESSVGTSWVLWQANLVGALLGSNNLSDLVSAETARNNLGLGAADVVTFEKLIARQDGGVAGTDDVEIYHDGTDAWVRAKSGNMQFRAPGYFFFVRESDGSPLAWFTNFSDLVLNGGRFYLSPNTNGFQIEDANTTKIIGTGDALRDLRLRNVKLSPQTLTYAATTTLDLTGEGVETVTLTGDVTFQTSNRASGLRKTVRIIASGASRNITWPAWVPLGAALPASLADGKTMVVDLLCFGTAETDVIAAVGVQP